MRDNRRIDISVSPGGTFFRRVFALLGGITLIVGLVALAACDSGKGATATATATPSSGGSGGSGPRLSFKETEHDFGQLNYSSPMEYRWALTNTGNAPLQISDVKTEPLDPTS